MARTSNKKVNDLKLPKYLRLAKGIMWFDTLGENCSNIRLYNTNTQFIGRGYISDSEYDEFITEGYSIRKEIPKDSNNNENSEAGAYGKIKINNNSFFEVSTIDSSKLSNIITAYNNGVLVEFNPDKIIEPKSIKQNIKNFSYKKGTQNGTDGDLIFTGKNKHMYDKLQNAKHEDLINFIKNAPLSARNNLMDLYDYELNGYNRLNRPRSSILDVLKAKLNELGPGMSSITVESATSTTNKVDEKDNSQKE